MLSSTIDVQLGNVRELSRQSRHFEALAAAESLAIGAPENRDVLYLIAANQRCLQRIHDALDTLQRLEQQHPRFSLLYQERGYCHVALRNAPLAIASFLQAVKLNPALAASWTMLEHLYPMAADDVELLRSYARALLNRQKYREAIQVTEELLKPDPGNQ